MAVYSDRTTRITIYVLIAAICLNLVTPRGLPEEPMEGGRDENWRSLQDTHGVTSETRGRKHESFDCTEPECRKKTGTEVSKESSGESKVSPRKNDDKQLPTPVEFGIHLERGIPSNTDGASKSDTRTGKENVESKRKGNRAGKRRSQKKKKRDHKKGQKTHKHRKHSEIGSANLPAEHTQADASSWFSKLSQPPEVARLEQRLHPSVGSPIQNLKASLERIFHTVQSSVRRVEADYSYVFNSTRYDIMMGVRKELMKITKANNDVYDVVLEASLLTKDIYKRAHQQRLTGPRTFPVAVSASDIMETKDLNLHSYHYQAQTEQHLAEALKHKIANSRRQRETQSVRFMKLQRAVEEKLPTLGLRDLARRANQTMILLRSGMPDIDIQDNIHLQYYAVNTHANNVKQAKNLTRDAKDAMFHAKNMFSMCQNIHYKVQRLLPQTSGEIVMDVPFDDARMMLWASVDSATMHADNLFDQATDLHMKLKPVLVKAKNAMTHTDKSYFTRRLEAKAFELRETIKHLDHALNAIYKILGLERILPSTTTDTTLTPSQSTEEPDLTQSTTKAPPISKQTEPNKTEVILPTPEGSGCSDDEEDCDPVVITDPDSVEIGSGEEIESSGEGNDEELDTIPTSGRTSDSTSSHVVVSKEISELKAENKTSAKKSELEKTAMTDTVDESGMDVEIIDEGDPENDDSDFGFPDFFGFLSDDAAADKGHPRSDKVSEVEMTINEVLRKRLNVLSNGSRTLHDRAVQLKPKVDEMSAQCKKIGNRFAEVDNNTQHGRAFVQEFAAKRLMADAIHDRIASVSERVHLMMGLVEKQSNNAIELAEKKVKSMEARRDQSKATETGGDVDPEDIHTTIESVKTAVQNINEISRLKQVHPDPCNRAQTLGRRIRANITELQEKIKKAKTVASSIQMAVSLKGSGYLTVPMKREDVPKSLTMTMNMMVKTSDVDGPIAALHTNDYGSVVVSVKDRYPSLTVLDKDYDDLDDIESKYQMENNAWYRLSVTRSALTYQLDVYSEQNNITFSGNVMVDKDDIESAQAHPSSVYFGGLPDDFPTFGSGFWEGCVGQVTVDGHYIGLLASDSAGNKPQICSTQVMTDPKYGINLGGRGYGLFPWSLVDRRNIDDLQMTFTATSDGILFYSVDSTRQSHSLMYISNGTLKIEVKQSGINTALETSTNIYSSGRKHTLQLSATRALTVTINEDQSALVTIAPFSHRILPSSVPDGIYVGGLSLRNRTAIESLSGCISEFKINSKDIPLSQIEESRDVYYGTCDKTKCVSFTTESLPISLQEGAGRNNLRFSFSKGSLGPVLQYAKANDFDMTLTVNSGGMDIEEIETDTSKRIEFGSETIILVSISDDGDTVTVTAEGVEIEMDYGGFWGTAKNTYGHNYSMNIGGTAEDDKFEGEIFEFTTADRKFDFSSYMESNKLRRCTGPRLVAEEKLEEKFVCQ